MASTARIDELKRKFDENPRRYFAPLANEFRKLGDVEQAILICEEFLPQQPGHMSGHIVYGQALYESARMEDARSVFETALGLDPENLIALRHLGDIARGQGDVDAALRWYVRVLDADPRNEEIQTLIASLSPQAEPEPELAAALEDDERFAAPPLDQPSGPAVPAFAIPADAGPLEIELGDSSPLGGESPFAEPERAEFLSLDGFEPTAQHEPEISSAGAPAAGLESGHFPGIPDAEDEPLDAEASFEKGITSFAFPATPHQPVAAPAGLGSHAYEGGADLLDDEPLELDDAASLPPHGDPIVPAAGGSSLDFGAEPAEQPVDDTRHGDPFLSMDAPDPFELTPSVVAAEAELMDEALAIGAPEGLATARAEAQRLPELETPAETIPVAPHAPFVTETMAELYLRQGFRDQAWAVYRQLSEASPEDDRLRARMEALAPRAEERAPEEPIAEETPARELPGEEAMQPAPVSAGPNIREFLAEIAARRPGSPGAAASGAPSMAPPSNDDFATFEAVPEPVVAPVAEEVRAPGPAAPSPRATAGDGSIDALFGNRPVVTSEDSAASALAQAFGAAAEPPVISGRPTRAASGELTLDSIFRDGPSARPPRSSQSFSFDQFFSGDAAAEGEGTGQPSGEGQRSVEPGDTPERSADDIEQFNSWLQGLKPR